MKKIHFVQLSNDFEDFYGSAFFPVLDFKTFKSFYMAEVFDIKH
jgi:hypothetical protein